MNGLGETLISKITTALIMSTSGMMVYSGDDVLTVIGLEGLVFLGITFGAWVKLLLCVSIVIIISLNLKKVYIEIMKPIIGLFKLKNKGGSWNTEGEKGK